MENFECFGEEKVTSKKCFERKVGWKELGFEEIQGFGFEMEKHFFPFYLNMYFIYCF